MVSKVRVDLLLLITRGISR